MHCDLPTAFLLKLFPFDYTYVIVIVITFPTDRRNEVPRPINSIGKVYMYVQVQLKSIV